MRAPIPLPADWGEAWLCAPGEHHPKNSRTVRAYDHHGVQLAWIPPGRGRFACDMEHLDRPCREMAEHFQLAAETFLRRWVATEVMAKLSDVPVLQWLKTRGLTGASDARILVIANAGRTMAFGFLP
jgi:hypothetical protein